GWDAREPLERPGPTQHEREQQEAPGAEHDTEDRGGQSDGRGETLEPGVTMSGPGDEDRDEDKGNEREHPWIAHTQDTEHACQRALSDTRHHRRRDAGRVLAKAGAPGFAKSGARVARRGPDLRRPRVLYARCATEPADLHHDPGRDDRKDDDSHDE